jgi:two-component system, OmpR family, sensor histidine kinase KdpD
MASALAVKRLLRILASICIVAVVTWIAYTLHAKAFIAGFLYLLLVLPIAFLWGFVEATIASILAVSCLDYFFTQPLLNFYISDPQDLFALVTFETVVLFISRLAARLRRQALETAAHQASADRLYAMSKELLFIDRGEPVGPQLARLIANVFGAATVAIWNAQTAKLDAAGTQGVSEDEMRAAHLRESPLDDHKSGKLVRPLSLGSRRLGTLCLLSSPNNRIDARSADAIASLAAIAMERERAFLAESSAEASRQSEQLRSAVLDGLAHAFKTPLATIQAASSGLVEIGRLSVVEEELVAAIQTETQHLTDLTTQALQTARLEDKQLKVHKEHILIETFLHTDWSQFARGLEDHPLEIEAPDKTCSVWADLRLLQMALSQFLDNASKYAEPASPIRLGATVTGSETVFSVHNRGSYIFPEEGERIFQRFYRSPQSRYRAPGTGIGLTVAKQIVEAHLGHVWMESDVHSGTTFYMGLPHIHREVR